MTTEEKTNENDTKISEDIEMSRSQKPDYSEILKFLIPKKFQKKTEGLMNCLIKHGAPVLKWNNNGQLIYK